MTQPDVVAAAEEPISAVDAVRTAEEVLRQAVHSTQPSTGWPGVSTAADIYTALGGLVYAIELLPQLLDQLTSWLEANSDQLGIDSEHGSVAERIGAARAELAASLSGLQQGRDRLSNAQVALAPLFGPVTAPADADAG